MSARQPSKQERDARHARIVAIFISDPELSRTTIALRVGCSVGVVLAALKSVGLYESRATTAQPGVAP